MLNSYSVIETKKKNSRKSINSSKRNLKKERESGRGGGVRVRIMKNTSDTILVTFIWLKNTEISPSFLVWKFCGNAQRLHRFGRFAKNCAFLQNFYIRKLGEITVFYAVAWVNCLYFCKHSV